MRIPESGTDALHKGRVLEKTQWSTQLYIGRVCGIHQVLPFLITVKLLSKRKWRRPPSSEGLLLPLTRLWQLAGHLPQSPDPQYRCYACLVSLVCHFLASTLGTPAHNPVWSGFLCSQRREWEVKARLDGSTLFPPSTPASSHRGVGECSFCSHSVPLSPWEGCLCSAVLDAACFLSLGDAGPRRVLQE